MGEGTLGFKGRVDNESSRDLWVLVSGVAYRLRPGQRSPSSLDADAVRATDGTPIDGVQGWIKVRDLATMVVSDGDDGSGLTYSCGLAGLLGQCYGVSESEFGTIRYDESGSWPR